MTVVEGTGSLEQALGRVVTVVGVFDGLHRGHEYLLRELRRVAAEHDARPMVITFDHHPDEILKGAAPPLLCDPGERLDRLAAAGVEVTVIETFDRALRETPFEVWVRRIADGVELAGFVMTPESAFGYERRGTPETIAALGQGRGFDVTVVPQFELDGEPVRSSDIRAAIAAGDFERAERLLGRPYSVVGVSQESLEDGAWAARIRTTLPAAMPPAGPWYEVELVWLASGPADPQRAEVFVDGDGQLWLGSNVEEGPVRVVFLGARMPDSAASA